MSEISELEGIKRTVEILAVRIGAIEKEIKILEHAPQSKQGYVSGYVIDGKIYVDKDEDAPLIRQGYTSEQWNEIMSGEYLCDFSYDPEFRNITIGKIGGIHTGKPSIITTFSNTYNNELYEFCRPAQLKGVMRPIFVEPEDKKAVCAFFWEKKEPICSGTWSLMVGSRHGATKYIEV